MNENTSKAPVRPRDKHNQPVLSDAERDPQKQMAQGRKAGLMFRQQHKHHDDVGEYFSSLGRVNGWGHESSYLEAGYDVNPGFDHDSFSVKDNNHHQSSFGEKVLDFLIPAAEASETTSANQNIGGSTSEFVTDADLDASLGKKLLIGSGRAFVKTGQGIKQLGLAVGEKLGFVEDGATTTYTLAINKEKELYYGTPVGQSTAAKVGEVFTDVSMAVTVPGGSGATGVKMVVGSAGAGAVIGGIQATEDGRLFSRVQNATVGAAEGAAGGYFLNKAAQGLHWAWQKGKVQHGLHTFDSKAKEAIKPNKLVGGKGSEKVCLRGSEVGKSGKAKGYSSSNTPNSSEKLTKGQIVHYLGNIDKVPSSQLVSDLTKIGFELVHAIPEEKIYKFSHIKNSLRGTGKAKGNLDSSKVMIELHHDIKSGPHMHIRDSLGDVYDKSMNNLTKKIGRENPDWHSRKLKREVDRLPEAHIKISEFVELNMGPGFE